MQNEALLIVLPKKSRYRLNSYLIGLKHTKMSKTPSVMIARAIIRAYQLILSPVLGSACRFEPTCSYYAMEAVERYGAMKGGWLAVKRVVRCNPWCDGGFDPVP